MYQHTAWFPPTKNERENTLLTFPSEQRVCGCKVSYCFVGLAGDPRITGNSTVDVKERKPLVLRGGRTGQSSGQERNKIKSETQDAKQFQARQHAKGKPIKFASGKRGVQ